MSTPSIDLIKKWVDVNLQKFQQPIQQTFVHKSNAENVAIMDVVRIDSREYEIFVTQIHVDQSHSFFFDHPLDHVPGMLLIEASRQMLTAIPHIFYGNPIGDSYILDLMTARFEKFAELDKPVSLVAIGLHKVLRQGGGLAQFDFRVILMQAGQQLGEVTTAGRVYDRGVMQKIRAIGSKKEGQMIMG